jgi:hypothetical protein
VRTPLDRACFGSSGSSAAASKTRHPDPNRRFSRLRTRRRPPPQRATRKPMLLVDVSTVFELRAATR